MVAPAPGAPRRKIRRHCSTCGVIFDKPQTWAYCSKDCERNRRYERTNAVKGKLLALIRSKLPQPDAEHERAVEAWVQQVKCLGRADPMKDFYLIEGCEIDEALRLMRARPASGKDEAAGETACPQCCSADNVEQTCLGILGGHDRNRATCWTCGRSGIVADWVLISQLRARQATCKDGLQVEAAGELLRAAKEAHAGSTGLLQTPTAGSATGQSCA